jgi:5'-nucleotidase/UDP-sugar diphosphatase
MVILDAGNFSDNPTPEGNVKTRTLIDAMGRLGYAAANVGERDLTLGYDEFMKQTSRAKFPFVSANIVRRDTKEPVFKPYVVLDLRTGKDRTTHTRLGIIGVTRFNPVFLKSGPEGSNLVIVPPGEALKRYMPELREQADLIVLLAGLHNDDAHLLARQVPGIDVIVGSYGAIYSTREEKEGDTQIYYAGNQGRHFGETRLYLGSDNKIERTTAFMHPLDARYPSDPDMVAMVNEVMDKIHQAQGVSPTPPRGASGKSATAAGGVPRSGAHRAP